MVPLFYLSQPVKEKAVDCLPNYNPIKKMHSFAQNLETPSVPHLRPIPDEELIDAFSLQEELFSLEQYPSDDRIFPQSDSNIFEESQEETMDMEEECFTGKRRHDSLMDYSHSKRMMLSKLQRLDRAPAKRRHI